MAPEYEIQFSDIFDQITAYAAGATISVVNPKFLTCCGAGGEQYPHNETRGRPGVDYTLLNGGDCDCCVV